MQQVLFPSPFSSSLVLTIDGAGEWATTTLAEGKDHNINLLSQIDFPNSWLVVFRVHLLLWFKVNSGEYKLMGLAPYGNPTYVKTIKDNLIDIKKMGRFG